VARCDAYHHDQDDLGIDPGQIYGDDGESSLEDHAGAQFYARPDFLGPAARRLCGDVQLDFAATDRLLYVVVLVEVAVRAAAEL
jgi:hypothetical protein